MLEGWEWIIIGVVALVIILWGPSKIPQFARALGRAKGEFKNASKEFAEAAEAEPPAKPIATTVSAPAPASAYSSIKTKDELLLETAHRLGIPTDGKTKDEITEEISIKIKLLGAE